MPSFALLKPRSPTSYKLKLCLFRNSNDFYILNTQKELPGTIQRNDESVFVEGESVLG